MIIYRLAIEQYSDDLSGTGSRIFGGRWNLVGVPVIYATENISLSALEILVRTGRNFIPPDYMLLRIDLPDNSTISSITKNKLKKDWKEDLGYSQFIGSEFVKTNSTLALKVPSAIIDDEFNFVLNPQHPEFKKVKIKSTSPFQFDKRFFQTYE